MYVHLSLAKLGHLSTLVDECLGWGRVEKGGEAVAVVTAVNYPCFSGCDHSELEF